MVNRWKPLFVVGASIGLGGIATSFFLNKNIAGQPISDVQQAAIQGADELFLKNVQIFFRHGARTPLRHLPGVPEVKYLNMYNFKEFHTFANNNII